MTLATTAVAPSELAGSWTFEPALLIALSVAAVVYGRGAARLTQRVGRTGRARRAVAFYAGLGVLAAALMSPLDALASTLFSAHMVQHLLLMVVAAPLLVYARPAAALIAGLPSGGREVVHRTRTDGLRGLARALSGPIVVAVLGALALWAWHMPALYDGALSDHVLHVAEHASFLGVALLFWSVVLASGTRRGVPRPVAIFLVFVTGVQSAALGAVLLFASTALYPAHAEGAPLWDMTPLEDQQLAGALMWGPPALLYIVTMAWLLVRWFAEMEDHSEDRPSSLVTAGEHA